MNPRAGQHVTHFGQAPLKSVLDLRGFNLNARLDIDPNFLKEKDHDHAHNHGHHDSLDRKSVV